MENKKRKTKYTKKQNEYISSDEKVAIIAKKLGVSRGAVRSRREALRKGKLNMLGMELTSREIEVMDLVSRGNNHKAAGKLLNLSCRTVDTYRQSALKKLGAKNSPEGVRICFEKDILKKRQKK